MDYIPESYVNLNSIKKISKIATHKFIDRTECAVYDFAISEYYSDDELTMFSIPLKKVFLKKFL